MDDRNSQWLIPVVLALAVAGALWYYWTEVNQAPPVSVSAPVEPEETEPATTGPRYPVPTALPERGEPKSLTPLPALDQSDDYFVLALVDLFGGGIEQMLADTSLIEKIVATVDNLPRSHVAERIRPVAGVEGPFLADGQDGTGQYTLNPASYDRYDFLVQMLATANREELVAVYTRFYPLFQEAYVALGYPDGYFNDRVIEVIDHLLQAPEVKDPIELVRPHVLYEYADPELEALSAGQKLLIRIGSEHAVRVKQFLEELRDLIAASAP